MMSTSLSSLAIVLLATSVANLSTTCQADQASTDALIRDCDYAACRDMVQTLLEKQPTIYQEIMDGQLKPGMPRQTGMKPLAPKQEMSSIQLQDPHQMSDASVLPSSCVPTNIKPDISSISIKNVASDKDRVVANMAGYVELIGQNPSYLPLNIEYVSVSEPNRLGTRTVTLGGTCIKFEIEYKSLVDFYGHRFYDIDGLKMFVKDNDKQNVIAKKICYFEQPFAVEVYGNSHYGCREVISHRCSVGIKRVANLVLKSFELEFDGREYRVGKREFSFPSLGHYCKKWNM